MVLNSITGVGPRAAEVILAEIGPDMSQFPSARHLAFWAGQCPGQRESAAVSRWSRTRPGHRPTQKIIELGPPATS